MTLAFIAIAFFAIGFEIRRWWTIAMPIALGAVYLAVVAPSGGPFVGDSPIPFLIVISMVATAAGVSVSRRKRMGNA